MPFKSFVASPNPKLPVVQTLKENLLSSVLRGLSHPKIMMQSFENTSSRCICFVSNEMEDHLVLKAAKPNPQTKHDYCWGFFFVSFSSCIINGQYLHRTLQLTSKSIIAAVKRPLCNKAEISSSALSCLRQLTVLVLENTLLQLCWHCVPPTM